MALFPTTPKPDAVSGNALEHESEWYTIRGGTYPSGRVTLRPGRVFDIYRARLRYSDRLWTDIVTLYNFYQARKGAYGTFSYRDFISMAWTGLYVGVGDGATTVFDLPIYGSTSKTLYKNGSVVTLAGGAGNWAFGSATGLDSRDRATLGTAPVAGDILTYDATGLRMVNAHFAQDKLTVSQFTNAIAGFGLEIEEVGKD